MDQMHKLLREGSVDFVVSCVFECPEANAASHTIVWWTPVAWPSDG
jgi:hypothetical protein